MQNQPLVNRPGTPKKLIASLVLTIGDRKVILAANHGKQNPAPVSQSGAIENELTYFRRRRDSIRNNPPKPTSASVVGSGTPTVYWSRTVSLN